MHPNPTQTKSQELYKKAKGQRGSSRNQDEQHCFRPIDLSAVNFSLSFRLKVL